MIKNYTNYFCIIIPLVFSALGIKTIEAQELRVFTLQDFDLRGNVKFCKVITDYGKEEFDFDRNGLLTKSVTRHSEKDYEITYYKYMETELVEKRVERYVDGSFDKNTSFANIYEIDTTGTKKVTERIVSYNQEFIDQYEYQFDEDEKLTSIIRNNANGTDETTVTYDSYKGETTIRYFLNDIVQKTVRTSVKGSKTTDPKTLILTKEFLEGEPVKAVERQLTKDNRLLMEQRFEFDPIKKEFASQEILTYGYDDNQMLKTITTKTSNTEEVEQYIYQFDQAEPLNNWVKKIISPKNTYTTRRIEYYEAVVEEPLKEDN